MINRIKNIIMTPKSEWGIIEGEKTPHGNLFIKYVLPLSLITAIAAFIGWGLIGHSVLGFRVHSISWGIRQTIVHWVVVAGGVYLTAFVIDMLAKTFDATKDFDKSFSLVAHAYTPMFIGGIFYILPSISWLASLCGLYSLYLLYIGLQPMMKVPAEKSTGYFVVSLIVMVVVAAILSVVLTAILLGSFAAATLRF